MDAGKYYALLRFEEASRALRAALRLNIVDQLGPREVTMDEFGDQFGFTVQGTRTFAALLEVMEVLTRKGNFLRIADRARECLAADIPTSRRPYLSLGSGDDVDELIGMLRGQWTSEAKPLYGSDDVAETIMDLPDVGREIAIGLASRARNFAEPLAAAIRHHAGKARIFADVGAGSPYVSLACLEAIPHLSKAVLVDRPNGMKFARELAEQSGSYREQLSFCEQDFFQEVPPADLYCLSNTAHDWLPEEYTKIMTNVRDAIAPSGVVCIHEPLLEATWNSAEQWVHALWMASYALTLFRLTQGKGTCYTQKEHDWVMNQHGFSAVDQPIRTTDGCTALFYRLGGDDASDKQAKASMQPQTR